MKKRLVSWLLASTFAVSVFAVAPSVAVASEKGRKNTALLLGGAAVYSLMKKKTTQGLVLGAAGVYAYKRYRDAKSARKSRHAYAAGYRRASSRTAGYRSSYKRGRRVVTYRNGHRYVTYRRR
jgi:chromate transport protein ChrA